MNSTCELEHLDVAVSAAFRFNTLHAREDLDAHAEYFLPMRKELAV